MKKIYNFLITNKIEKMFLLSNSRGDRQVTSYKYKEI